jgi:hypothetical protein
MQRARANFGERLVALDFRLRLDALGPGISKMRVLGIVTTLLLAISSGGYGGKMNGTGSGCSDHYCMGINSPRMHGGTCSGATTRCKQMYPEGTAICDSARAKCMQTGVFIGPRGKHFPGMKKQ